MTASLTEYPIHPVSLSPSLPLFLPLSRVIFYPLLLRSSDRNVKRDHYSPYDIANIVNSPPALCGLSITLSVRTMYALCARVSHAYNITLSLKWRCDFPACIIYILIISLDEIFPRNGFEENIFRLSFQIFVSTSVSSTSKLRRDSRDGKIPFVKKNNSSLREALGVISSLCSGRVSWRREM